MSGILIPGQSQSPVVEALHAAGQRHGIDIDLMFRGLHIDEHVENFAKIKGFTIDKAQDQAVMLIKEFANGKIDYDTMRTRLSAMGVGIGPCGSNLPATLNHGPPLI